MKTINLKRTFSLLSLIFIVAAFLLIGCSKQETKTTAGENTQKTVTQEQSIQQTPPADNQTTKTETKSETVEDKSESSKDTKSDKTTIQHTTINIPTAQCSTCKKNITKALNKVTGIKDMDVDVDNNIVMVNFDKSKTSLAKIENAITSAGYDANDKKADPEAYSKLDDCCKLPQDRKKNN